MNDFWPLFSLVISGVFSVLFWLLRAKLDTQVQQINTLFKKHDEDVQALQDLRVQLAGRHYERDVLDAKFERLETAFKEIGKELGAKMDRLSDALMVHISEER